MADQPGTALPLAAACAGAVCTGFMTVGTRWLVAAGWGPVDISVLRYAIAGLCLGLPALLLFRAHMPRRDLLLALALGGGFFSLFPITLATAMQYTTASRAAVILAVMPVLTLLLAVAIRQESFRPSKLVGALVSLGGVAVVMGLEPTGTLRGDLLMLAVAGIAACFNTFLRPLLQRHHPVLLTALFILSGVSLMTVFGLASNQLHWPQQASATDWWVLLVLGTLAGALPIWLFNWALGRLEASVTTVTMGLTPVAAVWMGVVLLDEPLTLRLVLGMLVVLAGIAVANWPRPSQRAYRPRPP